MQATASNVENNQTTVTVTVSAAEIEKASEATVSAIAQQINVKGFRKGKAPRQVVINHIGGPAVLRGETLRESLPDFYARAVSQTGIDPINQPTIDIVSGEDDGDLTFTAVVEVRPEVQIAGHRGLQVTLPSPFASDDEVEAQVTRLRETDSHLADVDRPIVSGDIVTMNVHVEDPANPESAQDVPDFAYTVGSGALVDGLDELILGLKAGEDLSLTGRGPGGDDMNWSFHLVQVRERVLPELTDEWVEENTEYATVHALRDGLIVQLTSRQVIEAQMSLRDNVLVALSDLVAEELVPESLVAQELDSRIHEFSHRLEQQRLDVGTFLQITGQTEEQLIEMFRQDALRASRIDLALRALVRAEGLEPTEQEIEDELVTTAESMSVSADILRDNLETTGRRVTFVSEVAKMKASRWLLENVTYVDAQGATIDRALLDENQADSE